MATLTIEQLEMAMWLDGQSAFWRQLVVDRGPRGEALAAKLIASLPERYRWLK